MSLGCVRMRVVSSRVVYENPLAFFSQSRNFVFTPPDVAEHVGV